MDIKLLKCRFTLYQGCQRASEEMANMIVNCGSKYNRKRGTKKAAKKKKRKKNDTREIKERLTTTEKKFCNGSNLKFIVSDHCSIYSYKKNKWKPANFEEGTDLKHIKDNNHKTKIAVTTTVFIEI
jgi:hypothetical protein